MSFDHTPRTFWWWTTVLQKTINDHSGYAENVTTTYTGISSKRKGHSISHHSAHVRSVSEHAWCDAHGLALGSVHPRTWQLLWGRQDDGSLEMPTMDLILAVLRTCLGFTTRWDLLSGRGQWRGRMGCCSSMLWMGKTHCYQWPWGTMKRLDTTQQYCRNLNWPQNVWGNVCNAGAAARHE